MVYRKQYDCESDKFQAIELQNGNKNNNNTNIKLSIENITINITKSVKLLGITVDNKLNFEEHISNLCKKASLQLNGISRLQSKIGKKEKETIINNFIYSNFNYCLLVWYFCSCKSSNKIELIQKHCLRTALNDNESDYKNLLEKSSKTTMNIKRMRNLVIEIFKTISNLDPPFLKDIF